MISKYKAFFKISLNVHFQYRVAMSIWLIGLILQPVIFLSIWSAVAVAKGGEVNGYTVKDFSAYYITMMFVNHMTFTWIMFVFSFRIKNGDLSAMLLKPIHPIHQDIADNLSYKLLMLVAMGPVILSMALYYQPNIQITIPHLFLFFGALAFAMILRFIMEWTLSLVSFWTVKNLAINDTYFFLLFFLSGQVAPLELLPTFVQQISYFLPFRWIVAFPIEVILNKLGHEEILMGFAIQVFWIIVTCAAMQVIWKKGVKTYSAVGS